MFQSGLRWLMGKLRGEASRHCVFRHRDDQIVGKIEPEWREVETVIELLLRLLCQST